MMYMCTFIFNIKLCGFNIQIFKECVGAAAFFFFLFLLKYSFSIIKKGCYCVFLEVFQYFN